MKAWALASNGHFIRRAEDGRLQFVRYQDIAEEQGVRIRWARVKSIQRAIEKLVRIYGQVCLTFGCTLSLV